MRTRIITIITLLLSTPMIIAQKSMDKIDRESFAAISNRSKRYTDD